MSPKYLEVEFGDNDFGFPIEGALQRLWHDMYKNNAHLLNAGETLGNLFQKLQKHDRLLPLLSFLVDVEYLAGHAEYATRGVHHYDGAFPFSPTDDTKLPGPPYESITTRYLNLTLKFRDTKSFAGKWKNGEHAYLDLETGDVATF